MTFRDSHASWKNRDRRIHYRGEQASRMDNVTDAVFGIAITLLIFNLVNPNSFADLLVFTKTLPAFLISISFIFLFWSEHVRFSEIYTLHDTLLTMLNIGFIALVIFYVYPLRFLTLFLTNFFFGTDIAVNIRGDQVPSLMIYYGFVASALYVILFLFYCRAAQLADRLNLNDFERLHTRTQRQRLIIMFSVPFLSILATAILQQWSFFWASVIGGAVYGLYTPAMIIWQRHYLRQSKLHDPD